MIEEVSLAIDTGQKHCSIALFSGSTCVAQNIEDLENAHSTILVPMIEDILLKQCSSYNELKSIYVNVGPGSYTGLRIGAAAAYGISIVHNTALIGVNSLDACATEIQDFPCIAAVYAGRNRYYVRKYKAQFESDGDIDIISANASPCLASIKVTARSIGIAGINQKRTTTGPGELNILYSI